MSDKIKAGLAAIKVIESWGVQQIYGLPSSSINAEIDALYEEQKNIRFIQVRHEEVGSLAAAMQGKMGGKIGVVLGSSGPGGTHLMNGLYDAREDRIPLLAIIGTRPLDELNTDGFQEMNQNPIYADVSIYNVRVAYAQQLPQIIDEAIRRAVTLQGVAVIEVPVNFGWEEIDDNAWYSSADTYRQLPKPALNQADIAAAAALLNAAQRPVIYAGIGTRGNGEAVVALSHQLKAPVAVTAINFDTFDFNFEALIGSAGRVAWKTGNEILYQADTIVYVGSDFPFVQKMHIFRGKKLIHIDINPMKFGKRHPVDVAILGDAGDALRAITAQVDEKPESPWYRACLKNAQNWRAYLTKLEEKKAGPLQAYQIFNAINQYADADAIYAVDVGNTTILSVRHLHLTPRNMWRTSPKFTTKGIGLPGAMAAKLTHPHRQAWNLTGDGSFSMVYPDIVTLVQHNLPSIHVVFSNRMYGFTKKGQEDFNQNPFYGVDFNDVDFAKIAEAQGAIGYTITEISQIDDIFQKAIAAEKAGQVVVIDAKISQDMPFTAEKMVLDTEQYPLEAVQAFKDRYEAHELKPFREFLEAEGVITKAKE